MYPTELIESLYKAHQRFPGCVVATRAHRILFSNHKTIRSYNNWHWADEHRNKPSLALMATGVGGVLYPPYCMSEELLNILYLLNTTASYFFIYKKSILITDQKSYVASLTYICTTTLQNLLQIVFLLTTHNFIIYLLIQIACTLANNIIISVYVLHPALTKSIDKLQRKKIKHFNLFVLGKGMSVPQDKLMQLVADYRNNTIKKSDFDSKYYSKQMKKD